MKCFGSKPRNLKEELKFETKGIDGFMKRVFSILAEFLLYLFVDGIGSLFYQPFHIQSLVYKTPLEQRSFVWDGLILMFISYVLVLLIEAAGKRLRSAAPATTVALALAALVGYLLKLGFITRSL